jgi:phosphinothricin acetyltransferase
MNEVPAWVVDAMTINFRQAKTDDATGILAIYAPYCESSCVSFETSAPSEQQMRERIARIAAQYPWLIGEIDGQVTGYVYASQHQERAAYRWSVNVAVYLSPQYHRRGLGRALYTSLFSILRAQGYFKAYAGVTLPNAASVGLHEAMGFQSVGVYRGAGYKHGRWHDVGWWQLELQPETLNPREPQSFSTMRDCEAVAAGLAEGKRIFEAIRR